MQIPCRSDHRPWRDACRFSYRATTPALALTCPTFRSLSQQHQSATVPAAGGGQTDTPSLSFYFFPLRGKRKKNTKLRVSFAAVAGEADKPAKCERNSSRRAFEVPDLSKTTYPRRNPGSVGVVHTHERAVRESAAVSSGPLWMAISRSI